MGKFVDWFVKQWQRVNLTYTFIRVPVDVLKLLIWFFIFMELSNIIPLTIENVLIIGAFAGVFLMVLGYVLERLGVFFKYQAQVDKIQTAERDVHRWRISGAFVARAIALVQELDTEAIDWVIKEEKRWFFQRGIPLELQEEPSLGLIRGLMNEEE